MEKLESARKFLEEVKTRSLIKHILSMSDDIYLSGHPEWNEITTEAKKLKVRFYGN